MLSTDFDIYNNFETAVLIIDSSEKIVFKNISFLKTFGNIKHLEKFSNYFSFDICVLDSDNLLNSTPLNFAISSKESFCAHAVYQKAKEQFFNFLITAFYIGENKLLAFKNITKDIMYDETEKKYAFIRQQYLTLAEENKQFA